MELTLEKRRELAQSSPAGLGFVAGLTPVYRPAPAHARLADDIVDVIEGRLDLLATSLPVQHGKTVTASVLASAFFLGLHPDKNVIACSYNSEFAGERIGKAAKDILKRHGPELYGVTVDPTSDSRNRWNTTDKGGMIAVGVDAGVVGQPGDLIILDDLYANMEEASNRSHREKVWEWYMHSVVSRRANGAGTILSNSRWVEDDFFAQLVALMQQIGMRVRVRDYPALAVCSECGDYGVKAVNACGHVVRDELGRLPGEALWPEVRPRKFLLEQLEILKSRRFDALFQGAPHPSTGSLFRREDLRFYSIEVADGPRSRVGLRHGNLKSVVSLSDCRIFATCDLAISRSDTADYFCCAVFGLTPRFDILVLDVVRARLRAQDQIQAINRLYQKWRFCNVGIEAVGTQAAMLDFVREQGVPAYPLRPSSNKIIRAQVASARMEAHQIYFNETATWQTDLENEMIAFPAGKHDDFVDCLSYACELVSQLAINASHGGPTGVYLPGGNQGVRIG